MAELTNTQQTLINGNRYSFVNLSLRIGDNDLPKGSVTALNYAGGQEPGVVQGNLNVPTGRTQGYATFSGSVELLLSEAQALYDAIMNLAVFGALVDQEFDIVVQYSINGVDVITDTLLGCRMSNIEASNQQGSDPSKRTHTLSYMRLFLGGVEVAAPPDEGF